MKSTDKPAQTSIEKLSYSDAMARLEEIVQRVERGDVDVDELAGCVKEAAALVRMCRERLRSTQTDVDEALKDLEQADGAAAQRDGVGSVSGDGVRPIVVHAASALKMEFEETN